MTKEWYKANGYAMSINIDQAVIDRAERDVMEAYVHPILPTADPEVDDEVAHHVANLAYLLVMQRSLRVTQSGVKEKTSTNSSTPDGWKVLEEMAQIANMSLKALKSMSGANAEAKVNDICKFKFTTNFIHS